MAAVSVKAQSPTAKVPAPQFATMPHPGQGQRQPALPTQGQPRSLQLQAGSVHVMSRPQVLQPAPGQPIRPTLTSLNPGSAPRTVTSWSQRTTPAGSYVPGTSPSFTAPPSSFVAASPPRALSFASTSPTKAAALPSPPSHRPFWISELKDRLWPEISRFMCQEVVENFQVRGEQSEREMDIMAKKLEAQPLPLPVGADWSNFVLKLIWPVVVPGISRAMKDILLPKLHKKLSIVAPISVEVDLGQVAPEVGEAIVVEDQGMGSFMDVKFHLHWHAAPKIVVTCKLGSITLPTLQLGCNMYLSFHGKVPEPPFFSAVTMYMGNAFMRARDVMDTDLALEDPYIGMGFNNEWSGLSSRFVEESMLGAINSVMGPWLVLPERMVIPVRETPWSFELSSPMPKGCLQVTVKGASGIIGTEWKLGSLLTGQRSNDPYVTVDLGGESVRTLRTPTCYDTVEPVWDKHNSYFFVIDALRLQHINIRMWDDGFLQQIKDRNLGITGQEDEMARKLGVRVLDLFRTHSIDFFDREQIVDRTIELDLEWPGKEEPDLKGKTCQLVLGLHWRPIIQIQPSQVPPDAFLEESSDEEAEVEASWPTFVLRAGLQQLEMPHFAGRWNDEFFVKCTILPGFDPTGQPCKEVQEGISLKTSDRVQSLPPKTEHRSERMSRMTDGMMGQSTRIATFEQSFRFLVRDATKTKVHLAFLSAPDFDPEAEETIGEVTIEVNSLLLAKDLAIEIKDEHLNNWTGAAVPKFTGHFQLWQIHHTTPKKVGQALGTPVRPPNNQKREAERLAFQAAQLRAQAEALERQARSKDSDASRLARRTHLADAALRVRVVSARGLRAADFNLMTWNTSDPFCVCEVGGQAGSGFKTHVVSKTLDPYWDFEGKIKNWKVGSPLKFSVYDEDWSYKNDLLGTTTLEANRFYPNGFVGELKLSDSEDAESYLLVKVSDSTGQFPTAESDLVDPSSLKVKVMAGRNLIEAYSGLMGRTACHLYCKCEIPGRPLASVRSQAVEHNAEPEWNYERQLASYREGDRLRFTVFNESGGGQDTPLAYVDLPSDKFYPSGFIGKLEMKIADESSSGVVTQLKKQAADASQQPALEVLISDSEGRFPKQSEADSSKLLVRIIGGKDLPASDSYVVGESTSDPYCTCEIQGRTLGKFRTQTVEKTLNPSWEYQHRVRGYKDGDTLKFSVYDEDWITEDDFLGSAVLKTEDFRENGFVGELRLDTGDDNKASYIKVAVSNLAGEFSVSFEDGARSRKDSQDEGLLKTLGRLLCKNFCSRV